MSKNQISILGLLILSLAANVYQRMVPAAQTAPGSPSQTVAAPPQLAPLPVLDPERFEPGDMTRLVAAGLSEAEARHLGAAQINSRFEHAKNRLRRIDDPWLTLDEIHAEATKRFQLIREAETRRREELETLTGKHWALADLDYSWSKVDVLLTYSGVMIGLSPDEMRATKSLIIEGGREVTLIKSAPFGITTPAHTDAIADVIAAQEGKMRELLGEERFFDFFKLWVLSTVDDVHDMEDRFGRSLSEEEHGRIAALLMPEHPLGEILGESVLPQRNLPDAILPQVRELVGEEAYANLMKFHAGQ